MARILHVAAHMGGGAGRFLSEYVTMKRTRDSGDIHRILLLEKPEKLQFVNHCLNHGITVLEAPSKDIVLKELTKSDLVILHWWHHPLMAGFLTGLPPIPLRLVLWVLANGCGYPVLPFSLAESVGRVLLATPYSLENPHWTEVERKWMTSHSSLVYAVGLGEFSQTPPISPERDVSHEEFRIGYVGTLSNAKLYPGFIPLCGRILELIKNARFIMVGDLDNGALKEEAMAFGIWDHMELLGYVPNVKECLDSFDIFSYPLNPLHYGTTENALLEAMAEELPAVAFRQCCEKYIIENGVSGFLADTEEEYARCAEQLYLDKELRLCMGKEARKRTISKFDPEKNYSHLEQVLKETMQQQPQIVDFASRLGQTPYEWFLSGLGMGEEALIELLNDCPPILKGNSKSSIFQFVRYYPEDEKLVSLKKRLLRGENQ